MTDSVSTLSRLFLNTCRVHSKPALFLAKLEGSYAPISTAEAETRVRELSLGFRELGLRPGDKAVILSENRPEWVMTDLAIICAGGVTVPIYTSLLPEQIKYIINDSDARIVVCSNRELWLKVEAVRGELPGVRHFVMIDEEEPAGILTLGEIRGKGKRAAEADPGLFERNALAVQPADLASIIYTSGTTGPPKGVMLSHANFVSNIKAVGFVVSFLSTDTALSFLPLSHVLERTATFVFLYHGATIAYAESVETVSENLLEVRPTIVISVPRLFEKMYARVMELVLKMPAPKKALFFWALSVGRRHAARRIDRQPVSRALKAKVGLAHRLVFSKILARTGGRIRFFICGGAPLAADIAGFFYAMGLYIFPGYGLTETSPVLTGNGFDSYRLGSAGRAIPGVEITIAPDGEILVRGPNVMKGYYKKEAETREVFQGNWFHTGDVGHLDEQGFLVITDRKKDIIVTAGGKNIAPQPIENILKTNTYVSNAVVIGDRRRFLSALIVPNFEKLAAFAKQNGIMAKDMAELVANEKVKEFMGREVERATPGLAPYEKIKRIILLDRDFEIEKEEITPTLKVKRNIIEERYKDLIDGLYREDRENKV